MCQALGSVWISYWLYFQCYFARLIHTANAILMLILYLQFFNKINVFTNLTPPLLYFIINNNVFNNVVYTNLFYLTYCLQVRVTVLQYEQLHMHCLSILFISSVNFIGFYLFVVMQSCVCRKLYSKLRKVQIKFFIHIPLNAFLSVYHKEFAGLCKLTYYY